MYENKRSFVYFRYVYPVISIFLIFLFLFIPCFSFVTSSGENDAVSVAELTKNAWQWSVQCLFGSGIEQTAGNIYFSQTAMILVALFYLLFIVAAGTATYLTITAFMCINKKAGWEKNRVVFLTFFFGRSVTNILQGLSLIIFIFPRILPFLYLKLLSTYVEVRLSFIDPIIFALVVYLIGVVLSVISAKWERRLGMDIFSTPRVVDEVLEEEAVETKAEESAFDRMSREAREEQRERILKLLNKNDDKNKKV